MRHAGLEWQGQEEGYLRLDASVRQNARIIIGSPSMHTARTYILPSVTSGLPGIIPFATSTSPSLATPKPAILPASLTRTPTARMTFPPPPLNADPFTAVDLQVRRSRWNFPGAASLGPAPASRSSNGFPPTILAYAHISVARR